MKDDQRVEVNVNLEISGSGFPINKGTKGRVATCRRGECLVHFDNDLDARVPTWALDAIPAEVSDV